jgi:DedD protein
MDKALKQRLVGASVLIAMAVVVLPMLLGGRPEPGQQTSEQIELPARPDGTAFETRRFPLVEEAATNPSAATTAETSISGAPFTDDSEVDTPAVTEPVAPQTHPGEVAATSNADEFAAQTITQEGNPATQGLAPITSVEAAVTEKVDVPVELEAGDAIKPAAGSAPTTSSGRYAVQVASLASEANARRLQTQLEAKGFTVISDTIESDVGRLSRVRVGPFDTEADAAAAVKKIQGQVDGVNPRMVDLDPAAAQSLNPSDPLVRWVVQLGSFGESSNAENLVKQVRAQGLSAYSEQVSSSSGAAINRVRVGPFLQREEATKAQQSLQSSLGINGVVMSAD